MQRICLVALCLLLGACTSAATKYSPSTPNQLALRNGNLTHAKVGNFEAGSPTINNVTLRGSAFKTSSATFNAYLGDAIRSELSQAGLLDPTANVVIGGTLTRNDFDGSGASAGTADLGADFWVDRGGRRIYQSQKSVHYEWKSSAADRTAISAAAQGYMESVQELARALFIDPDFQRALHKYN